MGRKRRQKKARRKRLRIKVTDKSVLYAVIGVLVLFGAFYAESHGWFPSFPKHAPKPSAFAKVHHAPALRPRGYNPPALATAPSAVYRQPAAPPRTYHAGSPKIVFVIDDIGHTENWNGDLRKLGNDVTYAILPFLRYSAYFDALSLQTGAEVILHLPLESKSGTIPGPGLIRTRMADDAVLELLDRTLHSVPHASGVNNHMGSQGTSDPHLMSLILHRLQQRSLFFMDSMTTTTSVASGVGAQLGYPILKRDVFLDNVDEKEAIRANVLETAAKAQAQGHAVAIGHYRYNTLRVLLEEIPRLKAQGFDIATLSDLLAMTSSR